MNKEMSQEVVGSLALGVGIVVLALVATSARKLGYIDADTVTRLRHGRQRTHDRLVRQSPAQGLRPKCLCTAGQAGCRMVRFRC